MKIQSSNSAPHSTGKPCISCWSGCQIPLRLVKVFACPSCFHVSVNIEALGSGWWRLGTHCRGWGPSLHHPLLSASVGLGANVQQTSMRVSKTQPAVRSAVQKGGLGGWRGHPSHMSSLSKSTLVWDLVMSKVRWRERRGGQVAWGGTDYRRPWVLKSLVCSGTKRRQRLFSRSMWRESVTH